MKRIIRAKLTLPQIRFFRDVILAGEMVGDCKLVGFTLQFRDYEGAYVVFKQMIAKAPDGSTREFVSWNSAIDRVSAAIKEAADGETA